MKWGSQSIDGKDSNATILFDAMVHAIRSGVKQIFPPHEVRLPPHSLPATPGSGAVDEPIAAEVIPVGYDLVVLARILLA